MSEWNKLESAFIDGALSQVKVRWGESGALLDQSEVKWKLLQLFSDHAVLLAEWEEELDRMVGCCVTYEGGCC